MSPGITIVASKGYPGDFEKFKEIKNILNFNIMKKNNYFILEQAEKKGQSFFIWRKSFKFYSCSSSLKKSRDRAIEILESLEWDNKYFRRDIGHQVILNNENNIWKI